MRQRTSTVVGSACLQREPCNLRGAWVSGVLHDMLADTDWMPWQFA